MRQSPRLIFVWVILLVALPASGAHPPGRTPLSAEGAEQPSTQPASRAAIQDDEPRSAYALAQAMRERHRSLRARPLAAGEKISLSTRKADLVEVLRAFALLADVNLVLDPEVQGEVTVELHEVAWENALAVILRTHRLAAERNGRIWTIGPP